MFEFYLKNCFNSMKSDDTKIFEKIFNKKDILEVPIFQRLKKEL